MNKYKKNSECKLITEMNGQNTSITSGQTNEPAQSEIKTHGNKWQYSKHNAFA